MAQGGRGGSGANGGNGWGGGAFVGAGGSATLDQTDVLLNLALGGLAGGGGDSNGDGIGGGLYVATGARGHPQENDGRAELRLHQQRRHLWHRDLPLSATAIFPRWPAFPRAHHQRPGEDRFRGPRMGHSYCCNQIRGFK